jgi:enoyl-CoA hydratase/carnithine racemase
MPLLLKRDGPIAILMLSRPEGRNAWDEDYNEGLAARLTELEEDESVRCVILTGDPAGKAFSAGANLKDETTHRNASPKAFIEGIPKWRKFVTHQLNEFPKPIVAAVNGYAIGIGCIATYSCDLIVASEEAELASVEPRHAARAVASGLTPIPGPSGTRRHPSSSTNGSVRSRWK